MTERSTDSSRTRGSQYWAVYTCLPLLLWFQIGSASGGDNRKIVDTEPPLATFNRSANAWFTLERDSHRGALVTANQRNAINNKNYSRYPSPYALASGRMPSRYAFVSERLMEDGPDGGFSEPWQRVAGGESAQAGSSPHRQIQSGSRDNRDYDDGLLGFSFPVVQGKGLYRVEVPIGTPAQKFYLELDTGSDLTWVKCRPGASGCGKGKVKSNPSHFDPTHSSSFEGNFSSGDLFHRENRRTFSVQCLAGDTSCSFFQRYADRSFATGRLITETLTMTAADQARDHKVPGFTLGCEHSSFGEFESGLLGLGRGMLSLPTQIGELYNDRFAYCFSTAKDPHSSFLRFGTRAEPRDPAGMKYVSMLLNPVHPTFYYVGLEDLSVGGERLHVSPDLLSINLPSGDGGVLLDSGTTYSYLPPVVYQLLLDRFLSKTQLPVAPPDPAAKLGHCFNVSGQILHHIMVPTLALHFRESYDGGNGDFVDIVLPTENYFKQIDRDYLCLAVLPTHGPAGSPAVIGNMWQRHFHILIDNRQNKIGFLGPKLCDDDVVDAQRLRRRRRTAIVSPSQFAIPCCLLALLLASIVLGLRKLNRSTPTPRKKPQHTYCEIA